MFRTLPPVRRPVPLFQRQSQAGSKSLSELMVGYGMNLLGSGTEALAAALGAAKQASGREYVEAILPAYGCPDLVTACVFAGVRPKLIDNSQDSWGYDLKQLEAALTDETVAIVAVNLLGAGDQGECLSRIARQRGIALIQDSAQYLPDQPGPVWHGDYVVFSFGRGKPLNLMHGGLLLVREGDSRPLARPTLQQHESTRDWILSSAPAALAFNLATHPGFYWFTSRMPGLGVGETTYSALVGCREMGSSWRTRVESAFNQYCRTSNYSAGKWADVIEGWRNAGISLLRCVAHSKLDDQHLRLPLLAQTSRQRDLILQRLERAGLGASAMYRVPLNRIGSIPASVASQGPFPAAEDLAARLFTLPTHDLVDRRVVAKADAIIRELGKTG